MYHPCMARKKQAKNYNVGLMQPDELNELKRLVHEYVSRMENIDNEIELLKEDKKTLREEFEERLDIRTVEQVLRILRIEQGIVHKDTYDTFYDTLKTDDGRSVDDPTEV